MQHKSHRLTRTVLVLTPALFSAHACYFGEEDVPIGGNGTGGIVTNAGTSGGASVQGGGGTGQGGGPGVAGANPSLAGASGNDSGGADAGGSSGTTGEGGDAGGGGVPGCYSPDQNLDSASDPDAVGCPCAEGEPGRCLPDSKGNLIALICENGAWQSVEDGPCAPLSYWVCGLPAEPGHCRNIGITRYAYDTDSGSCEPFLYHCEGNANNFPSQAECERVCPPALRPGVACKTPPRDTPCEYDGTPKFYFDPRSKSCVEVAACLDGGPNHFDSRTDCEAACDADALTAVIQRPSCEGLGIQLPNPNSADVVDPEDLELHGNGFTLDGATLSRTASWACGCPERPAFVITYTPSSPLELRLCYDNQADPCEGICMEQELTWDLSEAFAAAGTSDFVFVE